MRYLPKIIITLIALGLLTGCFYSGKSPGKDKPETGGETDNLDLGEPLAPVPSPESSRSWQQGQDSAQVLDQTYSDPVYGFSFQYPSGFNVSTYEVGDYGEYGDKVLLQKPNEKIGFQVFISEFDEPGPLTKERILEDLPDMAVEQPQHVIITQNKITALIFYSQEESLGKIRQVWFVHKGYVYQISALYPDLDGFLGPILEKFRFE